MRLVLIQAVLIAGITAIAWRVLRSPSSRVLALRRVALAVFALLAIYSVLFPSVWSRIADVLGVGRGTDMLLYALVVAFLSGTVTTYLRFRDLELRYTRLARRIALDEAPPIRSGPATPTP